MSPLPRSVLMLLGQWFFIVRIYVGCRFLPCDWKTDCSCPIDKIRENRAKYSSRLWLALGLGILTHVLIRWV